MESLDQKEHRRTQNSNTCIVVKMEIKPSPWGLPYVYTAIPTSKYEYQEKRIQSIRKGQRM
jgi:hypothetical protein